MEMKDPKQVITIHVCGPSSDKCECHCPESCGHKWDGPEKELDEGRCVTVTCSRCGMTAMEHSMWVDP
jgi:hypothetical protein